MSRFKIIKYAVGVAAASYFFIKPSEPTKKCDVYLARGIDTIHLKDVEIVDEQEEFCMFVHNGTLKIERAPYEVKCNQ